MFSKDTPEEPSEDMQPKDREGKVSDAKPSDNKKADESFEFNDWALI